LGGRDPAVQWSRFWDGHWRLVLFDLPVSQNKKRTRLRNYVRRRGYGCLQKSVWITPDKFTQEKQLLRGANIDVKSLIFLEGRPCASESDIEIVTGAWNFGRINSLYQHHLQVLAEKPTGKVRTEGSAKALRRWASRERAAWNDAAECDPLLPEKLLPPGYLGQQAWKKRVQILRIARRDLQDFRP
jgi:phenylacetic acid degradation operon negative regulatory protein